MRFSFLAILVLVMVAGCSASPSPATPTADPTPNGLSGRLAFAGSTTIQPLIEQLAEEFRNRHPNVELEIAAGGSVVGINAIQDGQVDIGMVSRELRPEEMREGMENFQIAIDVIAIIVHPTNPVQNLTAEQLRGIYRGEITNWSEVGGPDLSILPVIREISSGTRGAFDEIVLDDEEPVANADTQVTAGEVEARVASTPEAIGYVGFGNIGDGVQVIAINNVNPSPETAQDNSYQLKRPLQLLIGPLSRPLARSFVDFVLSSEGQQIVVRDGWVPTATTE